MGLHFPKYNVESDKAWTGLMLRKIHQEKSGLFFLSSDASENAQSPCGTVLRGVRTRRRYARGLVRILEVVKYIRKLVFFLWL